MSHSSRQSLPSLSVSTVLNLQYVARSLCRGGGGSKTLPSISTVAPDDLWTTAHVSGTI